MRVCVFIYLIFYYYYSFILFIYLFIFSLSDLCDDWAWDLLSSGLLVLFLMEGGRCLSPLLAASLTCGHVLTPGGIGQGHWGMRWPTVLGCLGRLALSGIGWGLCRGVWGRSGSLGPGPVHGPCLGGWGLAGSVGCCPWFPGGLCPMLMGALSKGFLCSLLGGCVVVPAVGFPGSVLRWGCW